MPAIHSLSAPPRPPAPATATPALRRATTSPIRESSQLPQAPPNLSSRRAALLVLILATSPPRPAAAAFSLGIRPNTFFSLTTAGPKELLREQKKKSARFFLAPIAASHDSLLKAQTVASANASAEDAEEARGRVSAAGRDCVLRERNSIVAFQSRTGVEVCTFSLILKNAASTTRIPQG